MRSALGEGTTWGKYIIGICTEIAKNTMVLANLLFVTGESYGLVSTVSR